jgi:hypothetical protein
MSVTVNPWHLNEGVPIRLEARALATGGRLADDTAVPAQMVRAGTAGEDASMQIAVSADGSPVRPRLPAHVRFQVPGFRSQVLAVGDRTLNLKPDT